MTNEKSFKFKLGMQESEDAKKDKGFFNVLFSKSSDLLNVSWNQLPTHNILTWIHLLCGKLTIAI